MASQLLRQAGGYILRNVGGALLNKGMGFLGSKLSRWMDQGKNWLDNNKVVGPVSSRWNGYDSFKNNMLNHGAMLADKIIPRTISVGMGQSPGDAFKNGIKNGLMRTVMGSDYGLQMGGGAANPQRAPAPDGYNPVDRSALNRGFA